MLRIDISTLKRAELARLLAGARARGQDDLARTLEAELEARGSGRKQAVVAPAEPDFEDDGTRPIAVPGQGADLRMGPDVRTRRPGRRWPIGLALAGALGLAGVSAWGLNGAPGLPRPAAAPPAAQRAMAARLETIPPSEAAPPAESRPSGTMSSEPTGSEAAAPPAQRPPQRPIAHAKAEAPAKRRLDPCATPATPADRVLCGDLTLNLLNREMRDAYGRARSAGADPAAIREGQAAWRRTRDPVSDPRVLAELYDRRIRELKAAAQAEVPAAPPERP